ncbi:uncharacterized protein PHALS_05142 [Plasmopara halstedii]|uniref:Uncharacterized protein n=1 Tax=Plasmopara halstedii TaxID=4781 RepID=A0A0P1B0U0_PLAHL|nr:uncharacterized protein PHALS_05142 [Plasmopara halstedii]CEG47808.1 hypothetical protein PHALS_05142 [Plasmopara halstedii]|eukprot:XP_024584177.1 hypothetical protein PHALS_05142 [Plasmopara halstedii]
MESVKATDVAGIDIKRWLFLSSSKEAVAVFITLEETKEWVSELRMFCEVWSE